MATSLDNIINAIKDVALNQAGFISVEEIKINKNSNSDTELPRLLIRMLKIDYSKYMLDTAYEKYKLELIIIIGCSDNPISNLKTLMDTLLNKMFTTNDLLRSMLESKKITLIDANLTNDRDLYSELGGEGVTIRMDIDNVNNFGGTPCQ